jgi:hypothetical protein
MTTHTEQVKSGANNQYAPVLIRLPDLTPLQTTSHGRPEIAKGDPAVEPDEKSNPAESQHATKTASPTTQLRAFGLAAVRLSQKYQEKLPDWMGVVGKAAVVIFLLLLSLLSYVWISTGSSEIESDSATTDLEPTHVESGIQPISAANAPFGESAVTSSPTPMPADSHDEKPVDGNDASQVTALEFAKKPPIDPASETATTTPEMAHATSKSAHALAGEETSHVHPKNRSESADAGSSPSIELTDQRPLETNTNIIRQTSGYPSTGRPAYDLRALLDLYNPRAAEIGMNPRWPTTNFKNVTPPPAHNGPIPSAPAVRPRHERTGSSLY